MRKRKKTVPRYRKILVVAVLFAFSFIVGCSLPHLAGLGIWGANDGPEEGPEIAKGEPVNILFLGIDARPGETNARSDTMMLACVDPELQKVAVISIPRDSRVDVPGSGDNKINSANAVGGPKAACKAVEKLLDTNVDYYVMTNFNGFAKMIDILGGVTIDVEKRMYRPTEDINLKPGVQHLSGRNALAYVRFRDDGLGDIGRTERQQKFLKAFADEMLKTKTILKIPSLIPELKDNVQTNMGTKAMLDLAKLALKFSSDDLVAQTLPGYFYDDPQNGLSYWMVDKSKSKELIASLMDGRKIAVIQESPVPVVPKNRNKIPSNQGPITKDPKDPDEGDIPEVPPGEPVEDPVVTPPDDPNLPGDTTTPKPQKPTEPSNLGPEGYSVST